MKKIMFQKIGEALTEQMFIIALIIMSLVALWCATESHRAFRKGLGKQNIVHVGGLVFGCLMICCVLAVSARPYLDHLYVAIARLTVLIFLSLTLYFFVMTNKIKKYKKLKITH